MALCSLAKIQLLRKFSFKGLICSGLKFLMKANLSIENLNEFHILLQNFLYATTLLMLRFILRPWAMYAISPNRRASDPHSDIPWGNSLCIFSIDFFFSPSGNVLFFILLTKFSNPVPSMISNGSITFPLDFDILFPSESHTIGWRRISLNGSLSVSHNDIMTILATQKNNISWPVYKTELGKKALKSGCSSFGHLTGEKGNSPELNHVSSTSWSCSISIYSWVRLSLCWAFSNAYCLFLAAIQFYVFKGSGLWSPFL